MAVAHGLQAELELEHLLRQLRERRPVLVPHAPELVCLGYRIEVDGRTIVYSGDSSWTEEFVAQARDADLFLCEAALRSLKEDDPEPQSRGHLLPSEAAATAQDAHAGKRATSHLGICSGRHGPIIVGEVHANLRTREKPLGRGLKAPR